MRRWSIPLVGLTLVLLVALACTSEARTPTSTPSPSMEWDLESIRVDGSTVTVLLRVYAGIDVSVTLDARDPDRIKGPPPVLGYVFQNVSPGEHAVQVRDVVGHEETAQIVVPIPTTTPP